MKTPRKRGHYTIFERDRFRCVYCGACTTEDIDVSLTVDHIVPVNGGGSDRADNLVTSCESCNAQKQDRKLDRETQTKYQKLARERNEAAGIPNHLIIVLGKTSAERRSRQRWLGLMVRAFWTWEGFMLEAHEVAGNLGPSHRAFEQAMALARVYMLSIHSLADYTRLTGDSNRSDQLRSLLEDAAIELYAAAEMSMFQHTRQLDDPRVTLEYALGVAKSRAKGTYQDEIAQSVGADEIEYVKNGTGVANLLATIRQSLDEAEEAVRLGGGSGPESAELRSLLSTVIQQFVAERLNAGSDREVEP